MNIGSLAKSVVRYFRRPATSVPPQITGYGAASVSLTIDPTISFAPPKAPATTTGGPSVTPWAEWQNKIDVHPSYDGWTYCKFGIRGPTLNDCAMVDGIVRGGLSAYLCRFFAVVVETRHQEPAVFAVMAGAGSGYALGIFATMDLAVEAAEIAIRMKTPVDRNPEEVQPDFDRFTLALDAAGFVTGMVVCRPLINNEIVPGRPMVVWTKFADVPPPEALRS